MNKKMLNSLNLANNLFKKKKKEYKPMLKKKQVYRFF